MLFTNEQNVCTSGFLPFAAQLHLAVCCLKQYKKLNHSQLKNLRHNINPVFLLGKGWRPRWTRLATFPLFSLQPITCLLISCRSFNCNHEVRPSWSNHN